VKSCFEPYISVVIPVRNEGTRIAEAVKSIVSGRSHSFPLQIVIVDDQSSDGCCEELPRISSTGDNVQVDVIRLSRWSGIPYARNLGAAAAAGEILFCTDGNVRFPSGWDVPIRRNIRPNRVLMATIGSQNSSFRGYGCALRIPSMGVSWLRTPRVYGGFVPVASSAGTIVPAAVFRQAGGFDTAMPVYGAAEPEFSVRLWLSGAEIVSLPDLVLPHRFRPQSELSPFLHVIRPVQVYNYLRFGLLYLDPPRVRQLFRHYASRAPQYFEEALQRVRASDVWRRRALLEKRLRAPFSSFVKRFGITDAFGRLAA
jgi:glycosyltransferase involved in cell wall biosynthesis